MGRKRRQLNRLLLILLVLSIAKIRKNNFTVESDADNVTEYAYFCFKIIQE